MERISSEVLVEKLTQWIGQEIYIHLEVNPGAYFRNGKATLQNVHVKGVHTHRVYLELDDKIALIHVDDLTHMVLEEDMVIMTGYDAHDRLARTLEVSTRPFKI